jgi:cytidylate kinase
MIRMTEPLRLYLAGPAGSGKTEIARLLAEQHGFARVSLGDLCRAEAARRGVPADRATLQAMGDLLRATDPARLAVLAWARAKTIRGPLVIEGVRLAAEGRYLRGRSVIGVAVDAPEALRAARLWRRDRVAAVPEHRTEREALGLPVDLRLTNGGDRAALERAVRLAVARAALLHVERGTGRGGHPAPVLGIER